MPAPNFDLSDNVDTLKAMVLAMVDKTASLETELADLKAVNASAEERIARLTSMLKTLERARFGRRSEKLGSKGLTTNKAPSSSTRFEQGLRRLKPSSPSGAARTKPNGPRGLAKVLRRISSGWKLSSSRMTSPRTQANRNS